jgi:hypothetical protein
VITATVIEIDYDFQERRWIEVERAQLVVEDDGTYKLDGPQPAFIDLDMTVVDPERRGRLRFQDEPARWVRLLPTAYRAGDVRVEVREEG